MGFNRHGSYRIESENDVISIFAYGPFNGEVVADFSRDIQSAIRELGYDHHYQIIEFDGLPIFIPEAERLLRETTIREFEAGLVASVFYFRKQEAMDLVRARIHASFGDTGVKIAFRDTREQALEWIDAVRAGSADD